MKEYERGLLVAFCRLNLTDAQQEIMTRFYPELATICGVTPPMMHGIPRHLFENLKALCASKVRIQAIKELRSWSIETNGPVTEGHPYTPALSSLRGAKDFIDKHFPA
jgi:hypothetical protein